MTFALLVLLQAAIIVIIIIIIIVVETIASMKGGNAIVLVRERTVPIERPPLVGEVVANFCG
jgi:hypothetical protein